MRFYWERVEASRNFANKVWNASRFIMMNIGEEVLEAPSLQQLAVEDQWILSKVNTLAKDDWYIEIAKTRTFKKEENPESAKVAMWTLKTVLIQALKLLHPFMPFITEEIFCTLQTEEETIMLSQWPEYKQQWHFAQAEEAIEHVKELIKGIRNTRTAMEVPPSRKANVFIVTENVE